MNNRQRINSIIGGIFTIALSILIFMWPDKATSLIGIILCITLLGMGIRNLSFYFTMARHMVGGKNTLYAGIIFTDLGLFTLTLNNISDVYIILYLLGAHAFAGVVDVLLALDAKRIESSSWRLKFATGLGNLTIAVAAIVFGFILGNHEAVAYFYGIGLLYSGVLRIINAFRKTAIVYIQ